MSHRLRATGNSAYDNLNRMKSYSRGVLSDSVADASMRWDTADTTQSITPTWIPWYYTGGHRNIETHYRSQNWEASTATQGYYERVQNPSEAEDPANRRTYQSTAPTGTNTLSGTQASTTDLFVEYDGWGHLSYKATATLRNVGGSTYTYDGTASQPKDVQTFAYDALGRRISESRTVWTSPTSSTFRGTTHLYYDAAGNVIEERFQSTPTGDAVTSSQYVFSLAGGNTMVAWDADTDGMTSSSDYGRPNGGLDQRMWVEQGPDGSVWQIVSDQDWDGTQREQYLYTPEGQVLVIKPQRKTYTYWDPLSYQYVQLTGIWYEAPNGNTNYSVYGFRYLWKGQRAEIFSESSVASGQLVDKFDGLYWTGASEHDSWRGAPLQEDVSAYFRSASSTQLANGYDQWTPISMNYPANGTGGFWNSIASLGQQGGMWNVFWHPSAYDMSTVSTPTADAWASGFRYFGVAALSIGTGGLAAGWLGGLGATGAEVAIGSGFAGSFAGGFAQSASQQLASGGSFSWSEAGRAALASGAIGGLTGGALYGVGQLLGMAGSGGGPSLATALIGGGTRQLAAVRGTAWALGASSGMAGALAGGGYQGYNEMYSVSSRQEQTRRQAYKYRHSESRHKVFPTSRNTWYLRAVRGAQGQGRQLVATRITIPLRTLQRQWIQQFVQNGYSGTEIADRMRNSLIDSGWRLGIGELPPLFQRMLIKELNNPVIW